MRIFLTISLISMFVNSASAQSGSFPGQFVHSVYFWLNNPENTADNELFLKNLNTFLENSKYLTSYHVAPPAGTDREVVDNSYHYNLVVTFETKELQDKYQTEEAHLKFIEDSKHLWNKVQIYDSFREKDERSSLYSRGFIEIGVVVSDLARSEKFYQDILGMKKVGNFEVNDKLARSAGLTDGIPLNVTVMKLIDNPHAPAWKLMSFKETPDEQTAAYINEKHGMRYITLYVNDMKSMLKRLRENNVTLRGDSPITLGDGSQFVLIQDPDGVFIELIGPRP